MGEAVKRGSLTLVAAIAAGCVPPPHRGAPPAREGPIIGWRLVNRPYKDLERLQLAGDAHIPRNASALVFEPIYADDEADCDPSEFVRLEVVAGERAHVGELVTARISVPNADEDACHVVDIRTTNVWTKLEGSNRLMLHGSEVKTIRFTSDIEGKAGIRVSALRSPQ